VSILVGSDTKLCVSGITGREGTFHSLRNRDYGTRVVAGVTPGKGGQDVEGIPVFNTFAEAVADTGANTAMVFVPPRFAADSILEAEDAGIEFIIAITEGIPAHDELRVYNTLRKNGRARLIGPASCRPERPTWGSSRPPSSGRATWESSPGPGP
jgi:succinyl-CoA synthetase alpha subunit